MQKTLTDFGNNADIQLPDEQLIAIKGGRRRRRTDDGTGDGDPGCPPDYED